ncbi:MAG: 5'-nucleotidase SurE [Legionellaceae bacterium]
MKLLLSNDDGVTAPGLTILANILSQLGEVTVVAPDRNRSGASNSLTLNNPLRVNRLDNHYISVEGTPTDCVHLALTGLFNNEHDIVVSGINAGANLGDDVFYSGTVAAAIEGRFLGLPAMAVSLVGKDFLHYHTAAVIAKNIVVRLIEQPLPAATILNINVPDLPLEEIQGYEVTRLGTRHRAERMVKETDPRGQTIYWVGLPGQEQDAGPGTDFYAVNAKRVSITPLSLDLTNYKVFNQIANWVTDLSNLN